VGRKIKQAAATVAYVDLGISKGMRLGIERSLEIGRPIELRMLDRGKFLEILRRICSRETAQNPDEWSRGNPLYGHCAVATLLAQDVFGGRILGVSLEGTEFASMRSHYFNLLPDQSEHDFTREQFGGRFPEGLTREERERQCLLSNTNTSVRYITLRDKFGFLVLNR